MVALGACRPEVENATVQARPVRTVIVAKREVGDTVTYTGRVQAESDVRLSFRISGRMVERSANVGATVSPGQVVAKLEPQDELNALRSAQAGVAAAQAQFTEARSEFERQRTLVSRNVASRAQLERAEQTMETARAQVTMAESQLKAAKDRVSYTELKVDAPGVVTATGAEPGEVVQAGQMVIRVARKDGRDAVFDIPGQLLQSAPSDPLITVSLTNDPNVTASGRVREVSPQADPVTRTFEVKVGLINPPAAMQLGSIVVGRMQLDTAPMVEIPATALTQFDRRPAVWVVDKNKLTVTPKTVEVVRQDPATVVISEGLDIGDIIVTAGVHALHPGQRTRLLGAK